MLPRPRRGLFRLAVLALAAVPALGQTPPKPAAPQAGAPKKAAAGPPAPQSKHFPILLVASGTEPVWSLRIGMKGAERLERAGYPPITLEPGEIEQDPAGSAWLYHARDTAAEADAVVRLSREPCSDGVSDTKYSFRVVATHSEIGELKGCAKIAPEQFPEFKQKNLDDDDPEKKKVVPPPITNFKAPVVVAYLDASGKVMVARGETAKAAAPKGYQLSFSHDGKRLLYTRDEQGTERAIVSYDVATGKTTELARGMVQSAFWSPDDAQIAFLRFADNVWRVWLMPATAPDRASQLAGTPVTALQGWQDMHTVLATDGSRLHFLKTESPPSSIDLKEIYGSGFTIGPTDTLRANPANPDLLLVSASLTHPTAGMPSDPRTGMGSQTFLYEIRSKRRTVVSPPGAFSTAAEWSRDGVQIFFTNRDAAKAAVVCRVFWDGSGFKRQRAGSGLVVGQ